jgi:hypothetical protein
MPSLRRNQRNNEGTSYLNVHSAAGGLNCQRPRLLGQLFRLLVASTPAVGRGAEMQLASSNDRKPIEAARDAEKMSFQR